MVFLPQAEAWRLDGIELPEAELYDLRFELFSALETHDREAAEDALTRLKAAPGGQRIALLGERTVASYDADDDRVSRALKELLELFPEDRMVRAWHEAALDRIDRREDRIAALSEIVEDPYCDLDVRAESGRTAGGRLPQLASRATHAEEAA